MSPETVREDVDGLVASATTIMKFVDKRFAHFDRKQTGGNPKWGDVDECVKQLVVAVTKYCAVIVGRSLDESMRLPPPGWMEVFKVAWAPPHGEGGHPTNPV